MEQIASTDDPRPFFGFVSFVGPHPPLAPPIPFNRMYNPDRIPGPILSNIEEDHLDEEIPFMGHAIWADAINPELAKIVKARTTARLPIWILSWPNSRRNRSAAGSGQCSNLFFFRSRRSFGGSSRMAETKLLRGRLPFPIASELARNAARRNDPN